MDALEPSFVRPERPSAGRDAPLSVGATVDLELGNGAGGHVKCWQRVAAVFAGPVADVGGFGDVDLTVYFLGDEVRSIVLGERARIQFVPPGRGTRGLGLGNAPGHTDLARRNPAIEPMLARHDVLHTTGPFALSGSAAWVAAECGTPLAASIHTDNPAFARIYACDAFAAMLGGGAALRAAARCLGVAEIAAAMMARRVARGLNRAQHIFYSNRGQHGAFLSRYPRARVSRLRRGIDRQQFHPGLRDRARLAAEFGVPPDRAILAFAGRIDASKNAGLAAAVAETLLAEGASLHLLMLGEGAERARIARRLGANVTLPGVVAQADLAWMLASADLFLFPSETETVGNVVLEAKACGLPVAVMEGTAPAEAIHRQGKDGFTVEGRDPAGWVRALAPVLASPLRLARHRAAARNAAEGLPSWAEVVAEDLVPVWRRMAGRAEAAVEAVDRRAYLSAPAAS